MLNDKLNEFKERHGNWINVILALIIIFVAGMVVEVMQRG